MRFTAVRRVQFCAGHRVFRHESKCAHVHGHNYVVFFYARSTTAEPLDNIGRVIDFSVLKTKLGGWIEEHWDHGMLLCHDDPIADLWKQARTEGLSDHKYYLLPSNPTAENIAHFLLDLAPSLLEGSDVEAYRIDVWETENCFATVECLDDGTIQSSINEGARPSRDNHR